MNRPMYKNYLGGRQVVGVIANDADLDLAVQDPTVAHGFEFRVDSVDNPKVAEAMEWLRKIDKFTILTVRDGDEGGKYALSTNVRRERFLRYLPLSTFVDLEAASARELADVISQAKLKKIGLIISAHYFGEVPHSRVVNGAFLICQECRGDVFKVASVAETATEFREFFVIAENLLQENPTMIAPMCMGKKLFAKASRLAFADSGARFIYGSLASAVVPGQWRAAELMKLLA